MKSNIKVIKIKLNNMIFGKIIIPLFYYLRGDFRYKYLSDYMKNLEKPQNEIKNYQFNRLKKLVTHAYETVPYYKKLFDSINIKPSDIKTINDFKKIPPIEKDTILLNIKKLISTKKYNLFEEISGGSTGNRVVIYKDKKYKEISRAIAMRDLYSIGIKPGYKSAWFWGSPIENKSLNESILHRFLWWINRRIVFNALNYSDDDLEKWIKNDFTKFKPDYIYGYTNSIYDAAKIIKSKKIKIPKIKKIITTSMKLENRKFIEDAFNCQVLDHYGCREVTSIAIEDEKYKMHTSDDFVFVEIGKDNKILLTPLESYGMPLLRYTVGDIGIKKSEIHDDKYPFNRFNLKLGRICETLRNVKGKKVDSGKINVEIASQKLNVGQFQLIQKSFDLVKLKIVKTNQTSRNDVEKFLMIIKKVLGNKKIEVVYVDKYPIEKNGKKIGYKCMIKDEDTNN
jgi:phenylacetate-CoA ligase